VTFEKGDSIDVTPEPQQGQLPHASAAARRSLSPIRRSTRNAVLSSRLEPLTMIRIALVVTDYVHTNGGLTSHRKCRNNDATIASRKTKRGDSSEGNPVH
jgi:hypothetical protein